MFVTDNDQYLIKSITSNPADAIFEVEMIPQTVVHEETDPDTGNTSYYDTNAVPKAPAKGEKFIVVENLSDPSRSQWIKLERTEQLVHHSNYTEDHTLEDGTVITNTIGGITAQATIETSASIPGIQGLTACSD